MRHQVSSTETKKEIILKRSFNAPRELVWKALTDSEWVKRWWGPKDFTAPVIKIDLRVGGKYLYSMQAPDGAMFWSTGVFREIDAPKKLVATDNFADEKGNVVSPTHYGFGPDFPMEITLMFTLEEENGKTTLTLKGEAPPSEKDRKDAEAGWNESFDKLAKILE